MDAADVPPVKGRELNYKCQSCLLTVTTSGSFFGYLFNGDGGGRGRGKGGSFKLNKHEFRCVEENTFVSGLGLFFLLLLGLGQIFFLKALNFMVWFFYF